MKNKEYGIVIDVETTGFSPRTEELLQVSIIDTKGNTLFDQYFKPQFHDSWEEAQAVNGISPEMVKNAPAFADKLDEINKIISPASAVIGHNVGFDIRFLTYNGVDFPANAEIIDTMRLFAPVYGEVSSSRNSTGGYKNKSLVVAADFFSYAWGDDQAHNSLSDCRATLYVYKKLIEKGAC